MADLSPLALADQILAAHRAGRVDHDLETTTLILAAEVKRLATELEDACKWIELLSPPHTRTQATEAMLAKFRAALIRAATP